MAAGKYVESLLGGTVSFPDLNGRVKGHFRYLSKKIKKASSEVNGGIKAETVARAKAHHHSCRRVVCVTTGLLCITHLMSLAEIHTEG